MSNNIKSSDLPKIWSSPDNSRLIPKQLSIRLPVHVAAKIYALEEIFPTKSRTQIIGDLLSCALEDIEDGLPEYLGDVVGHDHNGEEICEVYGPKAKYQESYRKHLEVIEKELSK